MLKIPYEIFTNVKSIAGNLYPDEDFHEVNLFYIQELRIQRIHCSFHSQ